MPSCTHFLRRGWPVLVALLVALFSGFLTWLTLAAAGVPGHVGFGWSVAAFLVVVVLMALHVINCERRYRAGPDSSRQD